jgi:hypothetical protein
MLSPRLLAEAESTILDSSLVRERLNTSFVRRMIAEHRAGQADHAFRLWNLWNLAAWHARWFDPVGAL